MKLKRISLKVSSNDLKVLLKYISYLKFQFKKFSVPFQLTFLPKYKTRFTLLRSPHVYKKSKEHFAICSFSAVFYFRCNLKLLNYIDFESFKKEIKLSLVKF